MTFCIPQAKLKKLSQALKDGTLDPIKLAQMSPEERVSFLSDLTESKAEAKGINNLFEKEFMPVKMGGRVTPDEAGEIVKLTKDANEAKKTMLDTPGGSKERVSYGRKYQDMVDYVNSLKPKGSVFSLVNLVNLPKSALTSILHFSAPFVQGWGMMSTKAFWRAVPEMFKYFASEDAYKNMQAEIISHPDYEFAKNGKLGLTKLGDKLNLREEAIQSSILEHAPLGLGKLVKASNRAFTGFLNYVRFNRFTEVLNAARLKGEDTSLGSKAVKDIAKVVNDFTGRGGGDFLAKNQAELNTLFFSPRKIAATIEMFDPVNYYKLSKTARIAAIRQLTGSIVATGAVITLATMAGASVDLNPTSANFMKIKVGDTTFDMTGGNAIYTRLLARIISGQEITSKGKRVSLTTGKFGSTTRADLAIQYLRDKLSPVASTFADMLYGTDPVGQPFSITKEVYDKFTPITIQEFIDMANSDPENTAKWLPGLSAIFGVQVGSPTK